MYISEQERDQHLFGKANRQFREQIKNTLYHELGIDASVWYKFPSDCRLGEVSGWYYCTSDSKPVNLGVFRDTVMETIAQIKRDFMEK